ncbi:protein kinase [Gordonia westfalica]|uniref:non-specific serine/threonine protein kinase n=1 Tax=Gordonia westfalica TaxID=158898 RepID=A0A1H2JKC7_9ACTN|nr:protein kinase [Gordonia westfalica]MDS1115936.1 protein kinase [Gordonia westfalica]SDU56601.1 Protein kinase domain-containing protein [Gordonia westfalica]
MATVEIPQQLADFAVLQKLGVGGNGTFYLAVPPARLGLATDRVVVKVFSGVCSDDAYRRGVRELRAFAAVASPYLAGLYDAVLQGQFMYAMEYFPMGSLGAPVRPLSRDERLAAVADAARGVDALHEAGIAHANITPSSIMVTETGGKISDLGLARVLAAEEPITSFAQPGAVQYMDPALLAGDVPSRATDIWSLGACLHRALTDEGVYGEVPDTQPLLAIRAALSTPPALSENLNRDERTLIANCLALAGSRPSTALQVAERIDALRGR